MTKEDAKQVSNGTVFARLLTAHEHEIPVSGSFTAFRYRYRIRYPAAILSKVISFRLKTKTWRLDTGTGIRYRKTDTQHLESNKFKRNISGPFLGLLITDLEAYCAAW
jgi:hypothetical protein